MLHTLGRLAITVDGRTSTAIAAQPVRAALLVYIGVERQTYRETAAGLFWPDSESSQARHTLSQTLYQLRVDYGDGLIDLGRETLHATPALRVDAVEFERAAAEHRHAHALSLYSGSFLPRLPMAGTNAFETWVDMRRAQLERLHRVVRRRRIDELIEAGNLATALSVAREWAALDPSEDEAWHRTIELLARLDHLTEAIGRYDEYVRCLAGQDLAPLEEITALVDQLREAVARSSPSTGTGVTISGDGVARPKATQPDRTGASWADASARSDIRTRRWWPRTGRRVAVAGVLLAASAGLLSSIGRETGTERTQRVLVLPLLNETGDPALDPLGDMAADWIAQGLAWTGKLQVVSTMEPLSVGRPTTPAGTRTAEPVATARRYRADLVLTGRYYESGDSIGFFVQITEVASGTVWLAHEPVTASPGQPVDAIERLRTHVMGALAARLTPDVPLEAPSVIHPPSYEAWLEYRRGAELFIRGSFRDAIPHLSRAHALDTRFIRPLLLEASGWGNSGDVMRQDSVIRTVVDHVNRLAPYERAHLEFARAQLRGDLASAYEAARRASELAPGGPGNYMLARMALDLGRPREALEIFGTLDAEPAWMPDWWSPSDYITAAHHALGEHERELELARSARLDDPRLRNAVLEIRAMAALGRIEELAARVADWSDAPADRDIDAGTMLWMAALELRAHGHRAPSDAMLERSVRRLRHIARADPTERTRWTLTRALALSGRLDDARVILAGLREGDPESIDYLGFEGVLAARSGDRSLAGRIDERLSAIDRPYLRGAHTCRRAAIAASLDDTEGALGLLRQAKNEGCIHGFGLHANPDFEPLWGDARFEAFIDSGG
jgi:DNA-binding SARP family transcriptional activator